MFYEIKFEIRIIAHPLTLRCIIVQISLQTIELEAYAILLKDVMGIEIKYTFLALLKLLCKLIKQFLKEVF